MAAGDHSRHNNRPLEPVCRPVTSGDDASTDLVAQYKGKLTSGFDVAIEETKVGMAYATTGKPRLQRQAGVSCPSKGGSPGCADAKI